MEGWLVAAVNQESWRGQGQGRRAKVTAEANLPVSVRGARAGARETSCPLSLHCASGLGKQVQDSHICIPALRTR